MRALADTVDLDGLDALQALRERRAQAAVLRQRQVVADAARVLDGHRRRAREIGHRLAALDAASAQGRQTSERVQRNAEIRRWLLVDRAAADGEVERATAAHGEQARELERCRALWSRARERRRALDELAEQRRRRGRHQERRRLDRQADDRATTRDTGHGETEHG